MKGILKKLEEKREQARAGEESAVVEAMKMENVLRAERDGIVASIEVGLGDGLEVDQTILTFEQPRGGKET